MDRPDERRDHPMVTAEVGSEGGSYADTTTQVATFHDDVDRQEQPRDTTYPTTDPDRGIVRYPTEPPSPPDAREGRRFNWRAAIIGAVAGAAGAALAYGLSRRRE